MSDLIAPTVIFAKVVKGLRKSTELQYPKFSVPPSNSSATLNSLLGSTSPYLSPPCSKANPSVNQPFHDSPKAHLPRDAKLGPLAVPRGYSGPWAVSCSCAADGNCRGSARGRGVMGQHFSSSSYHLLRVHNVQALAITLQRRCYYLSRFITDKTET